MIKLAQKDFEKAFSDLKLSNPTDLAVKITKVLDKKVPRKFIPPYPSNTFVLGFVDKTFSSNMQRKYDEYSFFVHSYFTSWHIFPHSSVLEFKILKNELTEFSKIIKDLLNTYLGRLFSKGN